MCELCDAFPGDGVYSSFFLLEECNTCGIPILVLKTHSPALTLAEQMLFYDILLEHFPGYEPRGIGMRSIPDHWHEHLVPMW
jgi:hypothetical protein